MSVDPDWEELVNAERQYFAARGRLFDRDPAPVLREALKSRTNRAALRVLEDVAEARPDLVRELVPELFWWTQGLTPDCEKARHILGVLGAEELEPHLRTLVSEFLVDANNGWQEHRGVAQLLDDLGLYGLLDQLMAVAASSDSIDMREVAEDYPRPREEKE